MEPVKERRNIWGYVFAVWCLVALFTFAMAGGGCSTAEGFGGFVAGAGADLQDAARGAREKMAERR